MIATINKEDAIEERIEELLANSENIEDKNTKRFIKLNLLSDRAADYEVQYYPIENQS